MRSSLALLVALLAACDPSLSPPPPPSPRDAGGVVGCARMAEGCPCDGAEPVACHRSAGTTSDGRRVCRSGTRYCEGGAWSTCRDVTEHVIGAGEDGRADAPLISGPSACDPCDPTCFATSDAPEAADLDGAHQLTYDPVAGGVVLAVDRDTRLSDFDGDGVVDVADDAPEDPGVTGIEGGLYVELPFGGGAVVAPFEVEAALRVADVYFLVDGSVTMNAETDALRDALTVGTFAPGCPGGVVGGIRCLVEDTWVGVGRHVDYPLAEDGGPGCCGPTCYGAGGSGCAHGARTLDEIYGHAQDLAEDPRLAQAALDDLARGFGSDAPQGATQALYAVATGGGLGDQLPPRASSVHGACPAGRWGYPCFREGAIPIVVHLSDAAHHNGRDPGRDYAFARDGYPVAYADVIHAVSARGIVGVEVVTAPPGASGEAARADAEDLASRTGSLDADGVPLVVAAPPDGGALGPAIVGAVARIAGSPRDVSAIALDEPSTPFDEGALVSLVAVSHAPGACAGVVGGSVFEACAPGARVRFEAVLRDDVVFPAVTPRVSTFEIAVRGDGAFELARVPVRLVVPPGEARYAGAGTYVRDVDASSVCRPGHRPEWGTLTWDIDTPPDTSVDFALRTARTAAGLDDAAPVTATAPAASPPLDIAEALLAAGHDTPFSHLRVSVSLRASSDRLETPVLRRFDVTFTCPR